ncbi:MAG: IS982 family transposase [Deltaproteobacteria bacterium]|nr:IS982 family transposase [Deltaproteobacteria bacterium]
MSEIITLLLVLHSGGFKYLKNFYQRVALPMLRPYFPGLPCYEQFVTIQQRALVPWLLFLLGRMGKKTGIYYIESTALPVCDNHPIHRHKTFAGLAARGKTSMGWFFGFKLQLVFNNLNEIVACKLTPGQVHDTKLVPQLTKNLLGKLFGDKGYTAKSCQKNCYAVA